MHKGKRRQREDHRNAVEYLCTHLAELNDRLTVPEWSESVKALVAETPFTEPWYLTVRRLHDLAEENGVLGGLGLISLMRQGWPAGWPGGEDSRIGAWVCPAEVCSRVALDSEAGATPPECRLQARPMSHVEV